MRCICSGLDIAVRIGTVCGLSPRGKRSSFLIHFRVFTCGSFSTDLSVVVHFDGLVLFVAGGVDDGCCGLFNRELFLGELAIHPRQQSGQGVVWCQPVVETTKNGVVENAEVVESAAALKIDAGDQARTFAITRKPA